MENISTKIKSVYYLEDGTVKFDEQETKVFSNVFVPMAYRIFWNDMYPEHLEIKKLPLNELMPSYEYNRKDEIEKLVDVFFKSDSRSNINRKGFFHKFGILLYGKEGTGKSSIIKEIIAKSIENHNAVCFYIDQNEKNYIERCWNHIQRVREIQDNPIIVVFEEFEQKAVEANDLMKKILDGHLSIDNCLFFATTNFYSTIPKEMLRPSRFKYSVEIKGIDDVDVIYKILLNFEIDSMDMAESLKGKTIDEIKERVVEFTLGLSNNRNKKSRIGFK